MTPFTAPSTLRWTTLALVACLAAAGCLPLHAEDLQFTDVRAQTREFIGYERSITLSPEQEALKKEALSALPAPCCDDRTAYTCCCPCNMARANWGLANHLIAELGYADAERLRAKVAEWIAFINPDGFSGDVCYTGGCGRAFQHNGCGGMTPERLTF